MQTESHPLASHEQASVQVPGQAVLVPNWQPGA